jgi:hypothetical protein
LRDRDAFPVFLDAIQTIQPAVAAAITRVSREVDASTADRVADTLRRIFDKVLKELSDFDNPMRTPTGSAPGVDDRVIPQGCDQVIPQLVR